MIVANNGTSSIYVGDVNVTASTGIPVAAGGSISLGVSGSVGIYAVAGSAGQDVRILELA